MRQQHADTAGLDRRAAAATFVVLLGLALPFIPIPGDRVTRIAVQFRATATNEPTHFTARTMASICNVLAAAMAYDDPQNGGYTHIDCGGRNAARAADGAAKMVGAGGIEPPTPTMSRTPSRPKHLM